MAALLLTIATFINAVFCIPVGALVDRLGPRLVGLLGVLLTAGAFALIGTATGDDGNWYLLWCIMAVATLPVQATIWTSAVASPSRSLADWHWPLHFAAPPSVPRRSRSSRPG